MEKLALALITASRKLRPYFQAHTIHVLTNFPLRQVLQKPNALGRLLKWAVELSKFNLVFKARAAIKGQALADFVAEFANLLEVDEIMEQAEPPTPEGHKLNSTLRFGFKTTNNVAEYEALIVGLRLVKEMQVKRLLISSDSQLVVNQVNDLRIENAHANALSKLESSKDSELLTVVPIEHLLIPLTKAPNVRWIAGTPTWMQPIVAYLKDQELPTDKHVAYKLRRRSAHFFFIDNVLYKRSFSFPLLRCVEGEDATYILREVHEGVCGNHFRGLSLAQKILRQGYYWTTLKRDALEQPYQDLTAVSSPWPFSKWGVDRIGPLPKGRGGASFAIVVIDYFTKWIDAEPLAKL
ncbi:uncharacterized protein LOC111365871 [Olea europaea var. sylvestris]|uniref:uncharacterized protein LOC111365871 n=1 Tax=Olea europaea var. sylvestris TaxID=158386 RepID=UPI000C1D6025|nr:uncharacterized protein LOC111365871 [Olea europaea var. sylvestris]